ncbi:hypothetical protein BJ508DRAFT_227757 [Ascobolus immersus RN42]|uniref:Transmembrane 9 superfamily member n=1 Tax=Ascobolus immersus RN42 TaxID=1160509 RepID=A0A3N4I4J3_ASCIM|nr:hypothetical protein BJ508DRAFT_227757 [Ascobolus immersus RN42]
MAPFFSALLLAASLCLPTTSAFYLPGVAPTDYLMSQKVPLNVNRLTPAMTEYDESLKSLIPYDYYYKRFQFCRPPDGPKSISESLGSILFGDRIQTSPFDLHMGKNETCKVLCKTEYTKKNAEFVRSRIMENYYYNWLIDGLPAASWHTDRQTKRDYYSVGFPLGTYVESKEHVDVGLNNHYDIIVEYHEVKERKAYRVVGVLVQPASISSKDLGGGKGDCTDRSAKVLKEGTEVVYTYSVYWKESPTPWATRWDKYLQVDQPQIHWFFLIDAAILVFFLTGLVATTLLRALKKDIAKYNQFDLDEDVQDDSGWKLVHGDVFRTPKNPLLLAIFLGSGAQLFFMTGATIIFAVLGFLSPSNRGSLATMMIVFYMLFGFIGGYVSSWTYISFGGENWKRNLILTPLFVPGLVFSVFFILNFFLIFEGSSGAVPVLTMISLVCLWFLISLPSSFAGSWMALKREPYHPPVRTNQIPRQIPPPPPYLRPLPATLLTGLLPFAAIMVELIYIMKSIWFAKVYYMFGFLFLCYGIMIMTCATATALMIYFVLCGEEYRWHWRAFWGAGMVGGYVCLNALAWWVGKLSLGGVTSNVLYLGYSLLMGFLFAVLTGTIGFFASWAFVHKIYSSIKID